jgi:hypothetical protein
MEPDVVCMKDHMVDKNDDDWLRGNLKVKKGSKES